MSGNYFLDFCHNKQSSLLLPRRCSISVDCYDLRDAQHAIVASLEQSLYNLAFSGIDLRGLDGITVSLNVRHTACELQGLPVEMTPLEMRDQPEETELARTVAVKRGNDLQFHIVLRAGLALLTLSSKSDEQTLARACIAYGAAQVEHKKHLYRIFGTTYSRLNPSDRQSQELIETIDIWSEYAACRSSAPFRLESLEHCDRTFCRKLKETCSFHLIWMENNLDGKPAAETFRRLQQSYIDAFISAAGLLGHLHGLALEGIHAAPASRLALGNDPPVMDLISRLDHVLRKLWLTKSAWQSLEIFAPIHNLLGEMMVSQGIAFMPHSNQPPC